MRIPRGSEVTLLFTAMVSSAVAHHSAAPHFDTEQTIELAATLTKFEFVNPHGYVYFTVSNPGGKPTPWRCELPARLALQRLGWTQDMFPPGRKITIKGAPARREENVCMLTSFVREDGREFSRNENITGQGGNPLAKVAGNQFAPRSAQLNGQPNLQGVWLGQGGPGGGGAGKGKDKGKDKGKGKDKAKGDAKGKGKGGPGGVEATRAGEVAAQAYDQRFDDPAIKCNPANIIFGWTHDQHVNEIVQKKDEVVLKYGYMDFVRTIHLNQAEHPKKITPSTAGHSIGKWEGDVLVVDTIGFKPSVLIPISGLMHSHQMHVVERFSVDNTAGTLTRAYRVEDPLYLKAAYTGTDVMSVSAEPYVTYKCVELSGKNNIRPKP